MKCPHSEAISDLAGISILTYRPAGKRSREWVCLISNRIRLGDLRRGHACNDGSGASGPN